VIKNISTYLVISILFLSGCSSKVGNNVSSSTKEINANYTSLADFLRRNSSVSVTGVEPNIRLQIRGVNSLTSDTRPFIYLDKNPLGRDYNRANNAINANNIKKVQVLSSLAQLTRYGQEGHSGIIIIHSVSNPSD